MCGAAAGRGRPAAQARWGSWQGNYSSSASRRDSVRLVIDMRVCSERGEVLARGDVGLAWAENTIAGLETAKFPMLAGICPFEDTVFNSVQREMLVAELDRLPADRQGPWVPALRAMCETAAAGSHRYVWLIGD